MRSIVIGAAAAAGVLFGAASRQDCKAANVVLTDGNSSVTLDPTSSAGVEDWSINGQNQINKEWFWFRNGSSGGQSSIDSLGVPSIALFDTNGNGQNDTAMLTYGPKNGIQIAVTFSLTGGLAGSRNSDLTENLIITNKGNSAVNYHFFEYANFNLGGSTSGQTVTIANSNTATDTGNGYQVQTVASPKASEYEANLFPSLLNHISSSSTYTLADISSTSAGDGEWGFQWDATIPAGGSFPIAVDGRIQASAIQVVPEPTGALGVLGVSGACLIRRRRRDETEAAA